MRWHFSKIQRFSLYKQIELFQGTQELIREKIGDDQAENFFQQSLYVVALGSNDFINNYLMPVCSDSWTYDDDGFVKYLTNTLRDQLTVQLILLLITWNSLFLVTLLEVLTFRNMCTDTT